MARVGVSAGSRLAAEAGAEVADLGGNAVDAAVAAAVASLCTDAAFVSPGSTGFVTVWPPDGEPIVLDAYAEVPGRGLTDGRRRGRGHEVTYGDTWGVKTHVGHASVATPGGFAGLAAAAERFGRLPWPALLAPALRGVEQGVPVSAAGAGYLVDAGEPVYGWHPETRRIVFRDGRPARAGERLFFPGLADSVRGMAEHGSGHLYGGELGARIAQEIVAEGGSLTLEDLRAYRVLPRTPLRVRFGEWDVALNPPPAVGGVTLAAMLLSLDAHPEHGWGASDVRRMVALQLEVLGFRRSHLHSGEDTVEGARELLASVGGALPQGGSASTAHNSAVDTGGLACAITVSDGYCSGVCVPGTGMLLNNALGEAELLSPDAPLPPPGTRLISNMAPTVARRTDGAVLSIGSPGADRITTALAQVLMHHVHRGLSLADAVRAPRLHVDVSGEEPVLVHEPGLPAEALDELPDVGLPEGNLYFGSVQAVEWAPDRGLQGTTDARRDGVYLEGGS